MKFSSSYYRLPEWHGDIINKSIINAIDFLKERYPAIDSDFDSITLRPSSTCRFSKYCWGNYEVRLQLNRTGIFLYDKTILQKKYNYSLRITLISLDIIYTSCLIHEFTHHIQNLLKTKASEIETTENQILHLKKVKVSYEKRDL